MISVSCWKEKRRVRRRYNLTAEMYEARYKEEQDAKYRVVLSQPVPKGQVLDLGCGSGIYLTRLSSKARTVVGVDLSKKLLLEAKEKTGKLSNVSLIVADADYLPFEDGIFEGIYSFTVLQNMPCPEVTLTEAKRAAQDGSLLVVTGLKKVFSLANLTNLFLRTGLTIISVIDDENLKCRIVFTKK